jgi:hypothetical protein
VLALALIYTETYKSNKNVLQNDRLRLTQLLLEVTMLPVLVTFTERWKERMNKRVGSIDLETGELFRYPSVGRGKTFSIWQKVVYG